MSCREIFAYDTVSENIPLNCEFNFAIIGLAHIHIYDMCRGLIKAGAKIKYVYDTDSDLVRQFLFAFPKAKVCRTKKEILEDENINLIVSAAVPSQRADLAIETMLAGKDFFVDKAPCITLKQLESIKETVKKTKRKYFVYYSESIDNEAAVYTRNLLKRGVIGDVFHIEGSASHLLNAQNRPEWFFKKKHAGGIITDIGCHQVHQFLSFSGGVDVMVDNARVANHNNKKYSEFEDFGDFNLTADNGVTGYFRLDWCSPNGLMTWGDPRIIIEGSKGYIELRKNCNIGYDKEPNHIFVVTNEGQFHENVSGKVEMTFFRDLITDCIMRTETAICYEQELKAIEVAIKAQSIANGSNLYRLADIPEFSLAKEV